MQPVSLPSPESSTTTTTRWYQLRVHAGNLPRVSKKHRLGSKLPNAYAMVFYLLDNYNKHDNKHNNWDIDNMLVVGTTETISREQSPQWTTTMNIQLNYQTKKKLCVKLFHADTKNNADEDDFTFGRAIFDIEEILESKGRVKTKRLRKGGCVFVRLHPIDFTNYSKIIRFQFAAILESSSSNALKKRLKNSSVMASITGGGDKRARMKSIIGRTNSKEEENGGNNTNGLDTILEISKRPLSSFAGGSWIPICRTKPVTNNNFPVWDVEQLDLQSFCDGDTKNHVRLAVYVLKPDGSLSEYPLGICEVSVRELLESSQNFNNDDIQVYRETDFYLQKNENDLQQVGRIRVQLAELVDSSSSSSPEPHTASSSSSSSGVPQQQATVVVMGHEIVETSYREEEKEEKEDEVDEDPFRVDLVKIKSRSQHALMKYMNDESCKLDLCVAIDFTGSNGDPRKPGTLHYQNDDVLNDYEETISVIGDALINYSHSKEFSLWGFGAKFASASTQDVQHLFQVANTEAVVGVDGILNAYRDFFRSTGLIMSGPTVFHKVIQAAAVRARKLEKTAKETKGTPSYCILLIITDGIMNNFEETKRKLEVYSHVPLSVIFVGVGRKDFSVMYDLCGSSRKNTTFVEFRQHQHDPTSLATAALQNIPDQLTDYMARNGAA